MHARNVAIAFGLVACCCSCSRKPTPDDLRKPRLELTVWLDPRAAVPSDDVTVSTSAPPTTRQMFERNGIHIAVVGVPAEGDPAAFMEKEILDAEKAGSNGTILVSTRCLKDLQLGLEKNISPMWTVPLVVGARCDGTSKDRLVAAALVEAGTVSQVHITFDVHSRAFFKVDPVRQASR